MGDKVVKNTVSWGSASGSSSEYKWQWRWVKSERFIRPRYIAYGQCLGRPGMGEPCGYMKFTYPNLQDAIQQWSLRQRRCNHCNLLMHWIGYIEREPDLRELFDFEKVVDVSPRKVYYRNSNAMPRPSNNE